MAISSRASSPPIRFWGMHMSESTRYFTFRRSARNFEEFAKAKKVISRRNLTLAEARRMCDEFNDNRTPAEVRRGTKMEFESGDP